MREKISKQGQSELLEVLRQRYQQAAKPDKTQILDEFVAVSGCHSKHAIRLLTGNLPVLNDTSSVNITEAVGRDKSEDTKT